MDENIVTKATEETAPAAESMDTMSDALDASMRKIEVGDIIDGTVVGVTDQEVTVDLAYAAEGIIRPLDYSSDPSFSVKENVHPGDEIKAKVLRLDDGKGNLLLSRREAMEELAWDDLKNSQGSRQGRRCRLSPRDPRICPGFQGCSRLCGGSDSLCRQDHSGPHHPG